MPFSAIAGAVASTALSAGISAITSSGQSDAVQDGSKQSQAIDERTRQEGQDNLAYDRANAQPYITTGQNALAKYADLNGLNGPEAATNALAGYTASPGYQYSMDQGLRAVDSGAAAMGILRSGATLKAEQTLGANLASQDFGNYLTRINALAGYGIQGASLDSQNTRGYNDLLTKVTTDQSGTIAKAAGQQASIYGNEGKAIGDALGGGLKNGLYEYGKSGTIEGLGGSVYNGAGTGGTISGSTIATNGVGSGAFNSAW